MSVPRLICCADDFGICPQRDIGIIRAIDNGIVTHTSVIVNGTSFADAKSTAIAIQQLTSRSSRVSIGLHFNLTEFEPCHDQVSSLCDPERRRFRGKLALLAALDELDECHIERELRAQLQRFSSLFDGAVPAHLDGHNHVHLFPRVRDVVARVAVELGIQRVRMPIEPIDSIDAVVDVDALRAQLARHPTPLDSMPVQSSYNQLVLRMAADSLPVFDAHGLKHCDAFVGLVLPLRCLSAATYRQHLVERLERVLALSVEQQSSIQSVEVMCHPGLCAAQESELDAFAKSIDREVELEALIAMRDDPVIRRFC